MIAFTRAPRYFASNMTMPSGTRHFWSLSKNANKVKVEFEINRLFDQDHLFEHHYIEKKINAALSNHPSFAKEASFKIQRNPPALSSKPSIQPLPNSIRPDSKKQEGVLTQLALFYLLLDAHLEEYNPTDHFKPIVKQKEKAFIESHPDHQTETTIEQREKGIINTFDNTISSSTSSQHPIPEAPCFSSSYSSSKSYHDTSYASHSSSSHSSNSYHHDSSDHSGDSNDRD